MVDEIVVGISQRLFARFRDSGIYTEDVKQGLREPCFFITQVSGGEVKRLGDRYFRPSVWDVQYFPQKGRVEAAGVGEELFSVLEYINVGDGEIRGTRMRYEFVDGVLHFLVSYNVFVRRMQEDAEVMGEVRVDQRY